EIFQDSEDNALCASLLPGVTVLRRTASRRDFHDAYNDALARASTPYLAFIDSDVFWTSVGLWDRVRKQLASQTTAAGSCVSRRTPASHGTFAVVMKVAVYRKILERFPDGFSPAIEVPDLSIPMERWVQHDTGDLMTRAVVRTGHEVKLLHLQGSGEVVQFRG